MNNKKPIYQHTQFSYLPFILIGPFVIFTGVLVISTHFLPIAWILFLFLILVLVSMMNMTVTVDRQKVSFAFGLGFPRKTTRLENILNLRIVENSLLEGVGIHWTFPGWLYNIGGRESVEIQLRGGSTFRVGSDEAGELAKAIETALIEWRSDRGS